MALFSQRRRRPDPSAYRAVFEAVRDAVIVLDGTGRVVDANPVAASSLVGDRNRALGHRLTDLLEPASPLVDLLQGGDEVQGHFRSPEGRELEVEIVPLRTPRGGTRGRASVTAIS